MPTTTAAKPKTRDPLDLRDKAAHAYAQAVGHSGRSGGWIYAKGGIEPLAQGWSSYAQKFERQIADYMTKAATAFPSFQALLEAEGGYRPTLRTDLKGREGWQNEWLANAYDRAQAGRRDPRRAQRS